MGVIPTPLTAPLPTPLTTTLVSENPDNTNQTVAASSSVEDELDNITHIEVCLQSFAAESAQHESKYRAI